jgi:MFS family permease
MLLPSLGISSANVALPTFAHTFGATFQQVQWVVIVYLLANTSLVVSVGRLGDLVGRRRLLSAGIAVFTLASVLCGLAPSLWMLIAARALQGAGAAVLMALTVAFVGETVPRQQTGRAMGLLGTTSAIGTALGPSLGGLLIAGFGWTAIFFVNLPLGLLALYLVQRHLPHDRIGAQQPAIRFDVPGTMLLALTLAAYALAMTLGRGQFGLLNIALLLGAAVGAGLFVLAEARAPSPLVRLAVLRNRALSAGLATSAGVSTVMMATLVVGPFYLSRAFGLSAAGVGLAMSAGPAVAALTGVPAGRVVDRYGAARMVNAGLAGMLAGCLALCTAPMAWGMAGYVLPLVLTTASYALFQAANNTAVMKDVPSGERGVFSGMLTLSRNLGLVTGASVMGGLFAFAAGTVDFTAAAPHAVLAGMRATFGMAAALLVAALLLAAAHRAPRAAGLAG